MSLLFADSFDGILDRDAKWDVFHANNQISTSYGRNSTNGLLLATNNVPDQCKHLFTSAPSTVTVGMWVNLQFVGSMGSSESLITLVSSATTTLSIYRDANNQVVISGSGAVGSPGDLRPFGWNFIEMKAVFGTSVEIRVNGSTIHSGALGGSGTVASMSMKRLDASQPWWIDDVYATDGTFLGPVQVTNIQPSGNGNRSQLVGSDGNSTDNYLLVSDGSDSTYVESATATEGDSYAFDNLSSSETVHGVVLTWRASDPLGGGDSMKPLVRSGTTDYYGTTQVLSGSPQTYFHAWDTDPDTATAWTTTGVDAAEFGAEVV